MLLDERAARYVQPLDRGTDPDLALGSPSAGRTLCERLMETGIPTQAYP